MPSIHVYEPALCCNTGVCGPDPAQELVTFTADLNYLKGRGADIARHNLAGDVQAFADSTVVRGFLQVAGSEGLPLVLVDDVTVLTGRYPTRAELLRYAGLQPDASDPSPAAAPGCCCGSSSGCC
ncbi:MAG: arsenite efflux transporter metallochaperone ArsD [Actinomycetia bacterium]|nr:arsenite efflux transporter metallochaperone ArsD [Actinomycetes bacterium]